MSKKMRMCARLEIRLVNPILDFKYYKQELDRQEHFATNKRAGICHIFQGYPTRLHQIVCCDRDLPISRTCHVYF